MQASVPTELNRQAQTIIDATEATAVLAELAERIHAAVPADASLVLVGIQRRGVELADRIAEILDDRRASPTPTGSLDITLYRDDFNQIGPRPLIGTSRLPEEINDRHVVIVDDVLHTGRTIRAALNELADFGRPSRIQLCVLVDRGGRELPIQPDYVGRRVDVPPGSEISVHVPELDGDLGVDLVPVSAAEGPAFEDEGSGREGGEDSTRDTPDTSDTTEGD
jgi:pyrimidine operon attenuation protein/uracil phosphoribosyltransferase